jgi:mannose-6-phosphate isomerase-like protein (cupin superfamily)
MNGDTREWWIVQSGTLRFTVDGREPVVATKGMMVQVPYRTLYQIEKRRHRAGAALRGERHASAKAVSRG